MSRTVRVKGIRVDVRTGVAEQYEEDVVIPATPPQPPTTIDLNELAQIIALLRQIDLATIAKLYPKT